MPQIAFPLLLALLSACGAPPPPRALGSAAVVDGPGGPEVRVTVRDLAATERIVFMTLVGPLGARAEARDWIASRVEGGEETREPHVRLGVKGGSSSGVQPWFGLGWGPEVDHEPGRRSRRVTGQIPLPDPQGYGAAPEAWHIEVGIEDATGGRRVLKIPAPPI